MAAAIHSFVLPAQAARTVGLVIGINDYDAVPSLDKAVADATAVARVLTDDLKLPRDNVLLRLDVRRATFLSEWRNALGKLENGSVLVFYFAGHGVELRGQNYLVPRDAVFDPASQVSFREVGIEVQGLFSDLSEIQKTKDISAIFILDACRENPFDIPAPVGTPRAQPRKGYNAVGLAPPLAGFPKNVFVMYSAGIGQRAADIGGASPNSVFTSRLLPLLRQRDPKLAVSDLAQSLRFGVYEEALTLTDDVTGERMYQTPAYYDQLLRRMTILGEPAEPVRLVVPPNNPVATKIATRGLRGGDVLIECPECPEVVLLPDALEGKRIAMGKFEVTRREWRACADAGRCTPLRAAPNFTGLPEQDRDPVTNVTWAEVATYLDWLSEMTKQRYRLPTVAEWEHAARAGAADARIRLEGDETICSRGNIADRSLGSVVWADLSCDDKSGRSVTTVGRFRPNGWGLFDMIGNAWEWTASCQQRGPAGSCSRYVAKGGSWRTDLRALRLDVETAIPASQHRSTLGFRVVREVSG